jgi:radical SAM protein with 4Fe4S-binding SPASM domain
MTNGLVLKDDYKRKYMEDNNIAFSLSFDGLWNKINRKFKNGQSSFDEYMKEPLKSYFSGRGGCKVMVAPDCVPTMVENFKWFVEEYGINSPDFTLVRDDVWTDYDVANFEIECHLLADQVIEYFNNGVAAMAGFFQLYTLDMLLGKTVGKRPFGCFAGCNGAGFMPDGTIYPCARFGSDRTMKIGNSITGEFDLGLKILQNKNLIDPRTFQKCLECELYNYCNGGCLRSQMKNSPEPSKYAEPIDNVCKLLKIMYQNTMRITRELKNNKLYRDSVLNSIKNIG